MTKQELIEQGFKYIATQNCEQKTEVWAKFTGYEDMIQYWYYFPETDQSRKCKYCFVCWAAWTFFNYAR